MNLLDFIKENSEWRTILTKPPYSLIIKEKDDYVLFKYKQGESDLSLQICKEARGIIIDLKTMSIACRAFDKFFNYGEVLAEHLGNNIRVESKEDGSLIKVWLDRYNNIRVSTNGNMDAEESVLPFNPNKTYRDLFNEGLKNAKISIELLSYCLYDDLIMGDSNFTLIFELVSPENRIVVNYNNTELIFLGIRDNNSGVEYSPTELQENMILNRFRTPQIYNINTLEDAISIANDLDSNKEGFVLVDENFNRVKVKGKEYLRLHVLRNNSLSLKEFLGIVLENKQDDLVAYFPEYNKYIHNIEIKLLSLVKRIEKEIEIAPFSLPRKEFALVVLKWEFSNILFKLYDNRDYNWKEDFLSLKNINFIFDKLNLE